MVNLRPGQNRSTKQASNGSDRNSHQHLIELRRVVKAYETAAGPFIALRDITMQIDAGEFVAVVGKSGSGKTTLTNMITGIDRPTSGEIVVGDTPVHRLSEGQVTAWRGRYIGLVFQFYQLLPTLTVVEHVMLPTDFCHTCSMLEGYQRAIHLLDQVGIARHAHKLPAAISGGEQQRVAIARALANDPPIVVADEPTGNLDTQTAETILQLFEHLVRVGKTVLLVTHDIDLASRASRILTLIDGRIVEGLKIEQVVSHPRAGGR
jgi:putative ABC transport system ATP-binding protein